MRGVYRPQLEFGLGMHRLLADERANLVWSPYSVASALGLVAVGAAGDTRSEITDLIAPGGELGGLAEVLAAAAVLEPGRRDADMAVSNPLWVRTGMPVLPAYEQAVRGVPGGAVHAADFGGDPEGSRRRINAEVEKVTRGLIPEIATPGDIQPDTLAALVSALWLRTAWADPFHEAATAPLPFHAPDGIRERPTMAAQRSMPLARADGWSMVSLAAAGGLVVDVLVPDAGDGAPIPVRDEGAPIPAPDTVAALYEAQRPAEVRLFLPRFSVEAALDLIPPLNAAGVRRVFTDDADLSGISPWDVKVSRVTHRAVLEADEAGLVGAAATLVVAAPGAAAPAPPPEPVIVRVDRPFLILVRHAGALLFLARITDPAAR